MHFSKPYLSLVQLQYPLVQRSSRVPFFRLMRQESPFLVLLKVLLAE